MKVQSYSFYLRFVFRVSCFESFFRERQDDNVWRGMHAAKRRDAIGGADGKVSAYFECRLCWPEFGRCRGGKRAENESTCYLCYFPVQRRSIERKGGDKNRGIAKTVMCWGNNNQEGTEFSISLLHFCSVPAGLQRPSGAQ